MPTPRLLTLALFITLCLVAVGGCDHGHTLEVVVPAADTAAVGDAADATETSDLVETAEMHTGSPDARDTSEADDGFEPYGSGCVVIDETFEVVPFNIAARFDRVGWTTFTSAEEFRTRLGMEPPAEIDFETEWAAMFNDDGWYGATVTLEHMRYCPSQYYADPYTTRGGEGCERLDDAGRAVLLIKFPAITAPVVANAGGLGGDEGTFVCDETSPARGASCDHQSLCQPGLLCAGLTRHVRGVCVPATQHATVRSDVTTPIPDGEAAGGVSTNTIAGLPGVDADVIVSADIAHASPSDLRIELVHPAGEVAVLWDHEAPAAPWEGWDNRASFYRAAVDLTGAPVEGTWQLRVVDDVPGNQGELRGWSLKVVSRVP